MEKAGRRSFKERRLGQSPKSKIHGWKLSFLIVW
jgi:hypothetical protein